MEERKPTIAELEAILDDPRLHGIYMEPDGSINARLTEPAELEEIKNLRAQLAAAEAEVGRLKQDVIAFCGPWAVTYARDHGLPECHLHPVHYDILERCGARMVDYTRAALAGGGG